MLSDDEKKAALENILEILKKDVGTIVILADNCGDGSIQILGNNATALGLVRMAEYQVINSL